MKRTIILFLVFSILLCLTSCNTKKPIDNGSRTALKIESSSVYSEAAKDDFSKKILSIFEKAEQKNGGTLSESDKNNILNQCNSDLFKTLEGIPVYEKELSELLIITDEMLSEDEAAFGAQKLSSIYLKASAILGNERSCSLSFEGLKFFLNIKAENDEQSKELLKTLTDGIGRNDFSKVTNVFMFLFSITAGILPNELSGSSLINDSEILMVLKKQAKYYAEIELSPEKWELSAKLFGSIIPKAEEADENIFQSIVFALNGDGFFQNASRAIPEFLSLYEAVINSLTNDDIAKIRVEQSNKLQILCRAVSLNESKFSEFSASLSENANTDMNSAYKEIKELGYEQYYLDFIDNMKYSTPSELFDAITAYGNSPSISAYGELNRAVLLHIFKLSPALAFAYEHRMAEGF